MVNWQGAMYRIPAEICATVDEIDTPALIVDLDAFDRNLGKMAEFARTLGVRLRPHAKTHKCPSIALKQIAAVAADANVGLCFDAVEQIEAASRVARDFGVRIDAMVEIDVGMQRCGVAPGKPASDLAQRIGDAPGLRFRGLQAYHGSAQHLPTWDERERAIRSAAQSVRATLERAGMRCDVVSGAGTGTCWFEGASGIWNELQVGSYVFMDTDYARIGGRDGGRYTEFEHSLFVLATVMSVPTAERAVVDAGLKSYSGEKGPPWVRGRPDLEVIGIADEHGKIRLSAESAPLRLGDKVMLIPGHCDPTVNLHDWYVGVRNARVETLWPITARGASS